MKREADDRRGASTAARVGGWSRPEPADVDELWDDDGASVKARSQGGWTRPEQVWRTRAEDDCGKGWIVGFSSSVNTSSTSYWSKLKVCHRWSCDKGCREYNVELWRDVLFAMFYVRGPTYFARIPTSKWRPVRGAIGRMQDSYGERGQYVVVQSPDGETSTVFSTVDFSPKQPHASRPPAQSVPYEIGFAQFLDAVGTGPRRKGQHVVQGSNGTKPKRKRANGQTVFSTVVRDLGAADAIQTRAEELLGTDSTFDWFDEDDEAKVAKIHNAFRRAAREITPRPEVA